MATLYVRNVPEAQYEALRKRAKANHRSIAAEFIELLWDNVPTTPEMKARHEWIKKHARFPSKQVKSRRLTP
jgi:plasmid stability protein